jgi:hypothetical protein
MLACSCILFQNKQADFQPVPSGLFQLVALCYMPLHLLLADTAAAVLTCVTLWSGRYGW